MSGLSIQHIDAPGRSGVKSVCLHSTRCITQDKLKKSGTVHPRSGFRSATEYLRPSVATICARLHAALLQNVLRRFRFTLEFSLFLAFLSNQNQFTNFVHGPFFLLFSTQPSLFSATKRTWIFCFHFSVATLTDVCGRLPISPCL